jgi:hypothetical protein
VDALDLKEAAVAGIVEGKHRSPIGDDGHQPNRPVPPPPADQGKAK